MIDTRTAEDGVATRRELANGRGLPTARKWAISGLWAAGVSIVLVLAAQAVALRLWPEAAEFAPLDSYARSALFTLAPAAGATLLFAWLVARRTRPVRDFLAISTALLLLSFIPDYLLPVAHRTLTASTIAAFLHLVAAAAIVGVLVARFLRWRDA